MIWLFPENSSMNEQKLTHLAQFYPVELFTADLIVLDNQLKSCIMDMHSYLELSEVNGISDLAKKMIKIKQRYFICISLLTH